MAHETPPPFIANAISNFHFLILPLCSCAFCLLISMERQNFWNTVSRIMSLLNFVISTVYKNQIQLKRKSNICKRLQNIYQSNSANKKNRLCGLSTEDLTTSGTFNGRYTNGGGVGGGCGDGSGGDPVEKEPALPVLASCLLGRLNLLVQLRGFDI